MREEWKMLKYLKRRLNGFIEDIDEDCILVWNTAKMDHAVVEWNGKNFDVSIYTSKGDVSHREFSLYQLNYSAKSIIDFIHIGLDI
jgi:hypothetical protein